MIPMMGNTIPVVMLLCSSFRLAGLCNSEREVEEEVFVQ